MVVATEIMVETLVETLVETKIMVEIVVEIAKSTAKKVHAQLAMEEVPLDLAFSHPFQPNAVGCHQDVDLVLINVPRSKKKKTGKLNVK